MKAELAHFDEHTPAAIADARALFAGLAVGQAVARPRRGAWSPAECGCIVSYRLGFSGGEELEPGGWVLGEAGVSGEDLLVGVHDEVIGDGDGLEFSLL